MPPWGHGPAPQTMQAPGGQTYLDTQFPMLTKINTCRVTTPTPPTSMSGNAPSKSTSMLIGKDVGLLRSGHRDVTPVRRFERLKKQCLLWHRSFAHRFWVGVWCFFCVYFEWVEDSENIPEYLCSHNINFSFPPHFDWGLFLRPNPPCKPWLAPAAGLP